MASKIEAENGGGDDTDFDGAAETRDCTDPICGTLFFVFLAAMGYLTYYAHVNGEVQALVGGIDWQGDICGYKDKNATSKLFWCGVEEGSDKLSDPTCVESCPKGPETHTMCPGVPTSTKGETATEGGKGSLYTLTLTREVVQQDDYPTRDAFGYCIPDGEGKDAAKMLDLVSGSDAFSGFTQKFSLMVAEIKQHHQFLIFIAIFSIFLGYAFLILLKWFIRPVLYVIGAVVFFALLGGTGYFAMMLTGTTGNVFTGLLSDAAAKSAATVCSVIVGLLFIGYSCLMFSAASAVETCVESVQTTADVLEKMPTLLLQPLIQSILQIFVLLTMLGGLLQVASLGEVTTGGGSAMSSMYTPAGLARSIEFTNTEWSLLACYVFCAVWLFEFITALGQYVISYAVVVYSIGGTAMGLPLANGYYNGIVYHSGTIAFGAFIVAFLKILSTIIDFLISQTKDSEGNQAKALKVACCCLSCCLKCLTLLTEWLNELVYVDCAINGTDYPAAAKNVVQMIVTNPITYGIVKTSTNVVSMLGTVTITCAGFGASYALNSDSFQDVVTKSGAGGSGLQGMAESATLGTNIAAGSISFLISVAFMAIFKQSAQTVMYCILWKQSNGKECAVPAGWQSGEAQAREVMISNDDGFSSRDMYRAMA